jgi:FkbM family methyltransferase
MSISSRLEASFFEPGLKRIGVLLAQPDFKTNPIRAVWRRVRWRLHWRTYPHDPVVLTNWCDGLSIVLPRSGSAAQIFYRDFSSPGVVGFMHRFIQDGMTVLDVGAHVGEYTLIAARLVGSRGRVHAFEPQPNLAELILRNANLNRFSWISVHACALTDQVAKQSFTRDLGSKAGWLSEKGEKGAAEETFDVQTTTLDEFCSKQNLQNIDFIKLDAAGNEFIALKGGKNLLTSRSAPALVVKLYHPNVTRERFGYDGNEAVRLLSKWNFRLYDLTSNEPQPFSGAVRGYCIPVLATHQKL